VSGLSAEQELLRGVTGRLSIVTSVHWTAPLASASTPHEAMPTQTSSQVSEAQVDSDVSFF
jgi:hypothetical protein